MTNIAIDNTTHSVDCASAIDELKVSITKVLDSNDAKIQFIKKEIDEGRYEINAEQIADKLLAYANTQTPAEALETA